MMFPKLKIKKLDFLSSTLFIFVVGVLIGLLFFGAFYGFSLVNPSYTDWIFYPVTHDTTQHFIGWEFFRADSTGGIVNGLAYPEGLPVTFMDSIPLIALPLKLFVDVLPASFQYFGLWALACYALQGGVAAILMRKLWLKIFTNKPRQKSAWQILFVAAGSLIFVLTPMLIARTLYHPALAAHWLILVGILLVWDAKKFAKPYKFILIWSILLVAGILIHPYFIPMLGAMMLISAVRVMSNFKLRSWLVFVVRTMVPLIVMGATFWAIGGFSLGSGAEIMDLSEKGFNLLSFINPSGYSAIIPGFPNASSSPETMMWLGLGALLMAIFAAIGFRGQYRQLWRIMINKFRASRLRNSLILAVVVGLLIFSIGVSLDIGPLRLFTYSVPNKIYEFWSAFRSAAREAWVFYYVAVLFIIFAFSKVVISRFRTKKIVVYVAVALSIAAVLQFGDIWFSNIASERRQGFSEIQNVDKPYFVAPDITDLVTTQKNLVMLDSGFRGDMSGTYEIAQAALANHLTLNVGFFARIPEPIWGQQKAWLNKIKQFQLSDADSRDYIFATRDNSLAQELSGHYQVEKRGGFWLIVAK